MSSSSSSDWAVLEQLGSRLKLFMESGKVKGAFRLKIWCANGKTYETRFAVEKTAGKLSMSNGCITIEKRNKPISSIKGNRGETACFEPRLVSEETGIKTTDVLQVLNTKLKILLSGGNRIFLTDKAVIKGIRMTPFRILRGDRPFYHKYGYRNEGIDALMERLRTMKFSDLKAVIDYRTGKSFYEVLADYKYTDDELVIHTMMKIGRKVEEEDDWSYRLFDSLKDDTENPLEFTLDAESAEWKEWREKVLITGFEWEEAVMAGGRRKGHKTRRRRRHNKRERISRRQRQHSQRHQKRAH